MPNYEEAIETLNELIQEIKELKEYLDYIERTDEKTMYLNDLIELKSKFSEIKSIK